MISATSSALSAVAAFQKKLDVTADNVANVDTDRFKKSRVLLKEGTVGGVDASVQKINTPGMPKETIRNDRIEETESSNVDLAEELTDMISTPIAYRANLKTVSTQKEMMGSLLDILG